MGDSTKKPGHEESTSTYCDSCDICIKGSYHKCTECYDFDYCTSCFQQGTLIHPGHNFNLIDCSPVEASIGDKYNVSNAEETIKPPASSSCSSCLNITRLLPVLHLAYEDAQTHQSQELGSRMSEGCDDEELEEDQNLIDELVEELWQHVGQDSPIDFDHFKLLPWTKIYRKYEKQCGFPGNEPNAEAKTKVLDEEENELDSMTLSKTLAEWMHQSLGEYFTDDAAVSHIEYEEDQEKPGVFRCKSPYPVGLMWPVRISKLVEATQRGCAFCSFFLTKVFATTFCDALYDLYGIGFRDTWFAKPTENETQRKKVVSNCMKKLTKLKYDRFVFSVEPIRSKKEMKAHDFNKLRFGLRRTADDHEVLREMFEDSSLRMGKGNGWNMISFTVDVYTTDDDPTADTITSRTPNASPGLQRSFDVVRKWAGDCDANHGDTCGGGLSDLPRRVIEIGDGENLRLRISSPGEQERYTALSYCWGGSQGFQTTTSSFEDLKSGFSISMLPKTMKDAIRLTKSIGIKYIWVDCLCILQDVAADKSFEFSQMAKIYKGAYITICATRAGSVHEGFLMDAADKSTGLWGGLIPLDYYVPDNAATTLEEAAKFPGARMGRIWLHDDFADWQEIHQFPTSGRGWCLQEQILSPRFLSYGRWPTWRCRKSTLSDGGYYHSSSNMRDNTGTLEVRLVDMLFDSPQSSNLSPGLDIFSMTQIYQAWYAVIHEYSRRKIGHSSDRLPAIAGIATEISRLTGCHYLVGLWQENILYDLMWLTKVREWSQRPSEWRAPTWSWASVKSAIQYGSITADSKPLATVQHCQVTFKDPCSPFGEVTDAWIQVKGPCALVSSKDVNAILQSQSLAPRRVKDRDGESWRAMMFRHTIDISGSRQYKRERGEYEENPVVEWPTYGLITFSREWKLEKDGNKVRQTCYSGLFLREAVGSLGNFERVGAFANESEDWLDQRFQPWEERSVTIV